MKQQLKSFYESRWDFVTQSGLDIDWIDPTVVHDNIEKLSDDIFMLIGESPASEEVRIGRPFQGQAGKNLNKLIKLSRYERHQNFMICNAFPFMCLKDGVKGKINRNPKTPELKVGAALLRQEIEIIKPKAIICLGGSALKALKYLDARLKKYELNETAEYEMKSGERIPLYIINHPSPIAYNQKRYGDMLKDFFTNLGGKF